MLGNSLSCPLSAALPGRGLAARSAVARLASRPLAVPAKWPTMAGPPAGRGQGMSTAALAAVSERSASAADAPRNPAAAAEYRKLLDAEEEAGLYEEPLGEEERVEVDASALPDDSLAVSGAARREGPGLAPRAGGAPRAEPPPPSHAPPPPALQV